MRGFEGPGVGHADDVVDARQREVEHLTRTQAPLRRHIKHHTESSRVLGHSQRRAPARSPATLHPLDGLMRAS